MTDRCYQHGIYAAYQDCLPGHCSSAGHLAWRDCRRVVTRLGISFGHQHLKAYNMNSVEARRVIAVVDDALDSLRYKQLRLVDRLVRLDGCEAQQTWNAGCSHTLQRKC